MMNLTRNWWLVVIRGLLAILFGRVAFFWPGLTWLVPVLMFGVYAIVDGVFAMLSSVAAGTVVLLRPELASFALIVVIAVWAILTCIPTAARSSMVDRCLSRIIRATDLGRPDALFS
ncbi:MAG TPA: DUF308 domain-containing protein [Anaerolineales bacterium]|nr:DUF308 domain-containing protein [Anaerolineales bacterium]